MSRWAIELSEYKIDYVPITAIKGQAIIDFIVELTQVDQSISWIVEVDVSRCSIGAAGLGIKFITPDQGIFEHFLLLQFATSNNVAKYEAVIHGFKIVRMLGVTMVKDRLTTGGAENN